MSTNDASSLVALSVAPAFAPPTLDLSPARWVWLPSQRTLPNTFVLFRREIVVRGPLRAATGWIVADSRYRLSVDGERVQWGPAPSDPRHTEADPLDLTVRLSEPGTHVVGAEVLYYGNGDGTWPLGKPGFLFRLDLHYADGTTERVVSDESWRCRVDRAHPPGIHRRWYLRALQEVFDARRHPHGWDTPAHDASDADGWLPAALVAGAADKPALATGYRDYAWDMGTVPGEPMGLRPRVIPPLDEPVVSAERLAAAGRVRWTRDPADWWEFRTPGTFEATRDDGVATETAPGEWRIAAPDAPGDGVYVTFAFTEQIVGWPRFTIDASEGTTVELTVQEAHEPERTPWLDSHFYAWTRYVCRGDDADAFEVFDYEALRWLQLHLRGHDRPVTVRAVGVRRRVFPWPHAPEAATGDPEIDRVSAAAVNTLHNAAQETVVDGMGRERQQYSGDIGHALHPLRQAFGETRLPARFLSTFSHGLTRDGYFLDCWPAWDRLARLMERQVGASEWGPLLDHGVGFVWDNWHHYEQTGDPAAVREPYPRLLRSVDYLLGLRRDDGLLPVEDIGIPVVWIEHHGYAAQAHKRCAWNLYAAAMLTHALAPLARAMGDEAVADRAEADGADLLAATVARFWDDALGLFVDAPGAGDAPPRLHDRTLATALLFDQCPGGRVGPSLDALLTRPANLGWSYPANAVWRFRALLRWGRADAVLSELRRDWATMRSVRENNTLSEMAAPRPDSTDEWSHCPIGPLIALYQGIAGVSPLAPGYARVAIRPQIGDLPRLRLACHTPRGPVRVDADRGPDGRHAVSVTLPPDTEGELHLPAAAPAPPDLTPLGDDARLGLRRYALPDGGDGPYRFTL